MQEQFISLSVSLQQWLEQNQGQQGFRNDLKSGVMRHGL